MNTPNTVLKVIFCVQLLLTTWAAQCSALFSPAYMYVNAIAMLFGAYAIVNSESSEAIFMYFCSQISLTVTDIIFLSVYNTRNYDLVVVNGINASLKSEYQFSLAMAIINLILRPVAAILLYRVYQDRSGTVGFVLPGLPQTSSMSHHGGYEDISRPRSNLPGFGSQSLGAVPGAPSGTDKPFSTADSIAQPALLASLN